MKGKEFPKKSGRSISHQTNMKKILFLLIILIVGIGIFFADQKNGSKKTASIEQIEIPKNVSDNSIVISNHGGKMEGHTPRGFKGMGTGLFAGDNLNPGFPNGDGVQFFLSFDISKVQSASIGSAILSSSYAHTEGTPFNDLGSLEVNSIAYNSFSSDLWNKTPESKACTLGIEAGEEYKCDITQALNRALTDGLQYVQFQVRFENAGDNDGSQDLILFYKTNSNTNEPGTFQLEIFTDEESLSENTQTIHLPVVLHPVRESGPLSTTRSDANILSLFKKSQEIWDQGDITFDVSFEEVALNDTLRKEIESGNFRALSSTIDPTKKPLHIFFLQSIFGSNGIAMSPSVAFIADVTTVNDFRATAHEIGHLLGLEHTRESVDRLLYQGVNGSLLTQSEILTIRSRTLIRLSNASE